jgi:hypothetical protein
MLEISVFFNNKPSLKTAKKRQIIPRNKAGNYSEFFNQLPEILLP